MIHDQLLAGRQGRHFFPPSLHLRAFVSFFTPLYVPQPLITVRGQVCVWPQLGIILAQIVFGPPCLSYNLGCCSSRNISRLLLKLALLLINPLWSDLDMIKGKASKHFMDVITHSLAICLTSMPSWHWKHHY